MFDPSALRYRLLDFLYRSFERSANWTGLLLAFVSGVLINALSDPDLSGPRQLLVRVYDLRRPLNWFAVIATVLLVTIPVGRSFLRRYLSARNFATQLSEIYATHVSADIRVFHHGRIAWGDALVLQSCPDLPAGWKPGEIRIHREPTESKFRDATLEKTFKKWARGREDDPDALGTTLRLKQNPVAFTDTPDLNLEVELNPWARTMFFKENVAPLAAERRKYIERALQGPIDFPHNLCFHAVIATSDDWILVTQRSPKVKYYPGTWSVSIEEQLSTKDFQTAETEAMEQWIRRLLFEELGIDKSGFDINNARVFAAFIETDVINCSLAGLITLSHDRQTLNAIIDSQPRPDYEFQDWDFISWSDLSKELIMPSRNYHPSSGLRMYLAGISHYGVLDFGQQLYDINRKPKMAQR
jgi:isopentenyldiphosphate isomerase